MKPGIDYIGVTVVFRCNDGNGNFLLHKRGMGCKDEHGMWDFGGGKPDFGEDLEAAALREIKEEYGINGEIQEQTPPYTLIREHDGIKSHWIVIGYFVKADIKKAKIMEPEKASEIGIFTLDKLPVPLHSAIPKELKMYKKYFEKYSQKKKP